MKKNHDLTILTIPEMVQQTNIPERKLRRLIASGFIPRANIPGRTIYVFWLDLVAALRQQQPVPVSTYNDDNHVIDSAED